MVGCVWVSVDPIRRRIDFYPPPIARRIESALQQEHDECPLGADFFNATVHLRDKRNFHQTTPGHTLGRAGYKVPGYRSVRRVLVPTTPPPRPTLIQVHAHRVHGEWRITDDPNEAEATFEDAVPETCPPIELGDDAAADDATSLRAWVSDDLGAESFEALRRSVVVWQWCRGLHEVHGDPLRLEEDMWCPYVNSQTRTLEMAFAAGSTQAHLQTEGRVLDITFFPSSSFGLQKDTERGKERLVRRVIKSIAELQDMLSRMVAATERDDLSERIANLPPGSEPPSEFFCPITQDVMSDPVLTTDGFTYDRSAITTWFHGSNLSPLTGLRLESRDLQPNDALLEQIIAWTRTVSDAANESSARHPA